MIDLALIPIIAILTIGKIVLTLIHARRRGADALQRLALQEELAAQRARRIAELERHVDQLEQTISWNAKLLDAQAHPPKDRSLPGEGHGRSVPPVLSA